MSGNLLVFEGANEVGKSTLAALLYTTLTTKGIPCELFAFPGNENGTLGRHVYELHHGALRFGISQMDATSVQLLHIAAHIDNIENTIKPALKAGRIVLLDRFWWSAWVYGIARHAHRRSLELMIEIEKLHWGAIRPRILFLVRRTAPVTPLYDPAEWKEIANLYDQLAETEQRQYRVARIDNDGSIDAAYAVITKETQGPWLENRPLR